MKEVLSIVLALVVGYIFLQVLLFVLSMTFAAIGFIFKVILIAVFAVPIYFLLRKILLKK